MTLIKRLYEERQAASEASARSAGRVCRRPGCGTVIGFEEPDFFFGGIRYCSDCERGITKILRDDEEK